MADPAPPDALLSLLGFERSDPPSILYHYTSMQGLLSIVESGRIRATHIRFLNDWSEAETMWNLVRQRLHARRELLKSQEDRTFLTAILDLSEERVPHNDFLASFSEEGDDLTQWRAYCPSEPGFSIGFSSTALRSQWVSDPHGKSPSFVGAKLVKVRYVSERDFSDLDTMIDSALALGRQLHGSAGFGGRTLSKEQIAVGSFSVTAPIYKNAAFRAESEWRMILSKPHKPMPGLRFRPGKSTIVPYVEVELNMDLNYKLAEDYLIRKVIVGPTPNPMLSVEALKSLFISKEHPEVEVEQSSIPYRHW